MRLKDKVILVTGASAGMGRCMAETFVKEGAKVVAAARRKEVLEELKEAVSGELGSLEIFAADCSKKEECEKMIDFTVETFGRLDVLVNNAGIMDDSAPAGEFDEERLHKVFELNTFGVLHAVKKAVNVFLAQGREDDDEDCGNIINISSIGARHHIAGVVYCASKAAVDAITKNTAYMYMEEGIRCNGIAPGGIITDIFTTMPETNEKGGEKVNALVQFAPPLADADAIANAAVYLASDESRYLNGQILTLDGGWMNL